MAISNAHSRAFERILRLCDAGTADSRTLRLEVLEETRRVVAFDAYAWLLTDPESEVGCAPLADVPCIPQLPRLIRLKYTTALNRWTLLDTPVALLSDATGGHPERSLIWRDLLSGHGVTDVASMVFRCRHGCWGFLDLWRNGSAFTEGDTSFLRSIVKPVTDAMRRCQAATFSLPDPGSAPAAGPVVLVLSPALEVQAQTPETNLLLRLLVPTDADREPIPAGAYNVAAQLLAVEAGIDEHPPSARVHASGGRWLTLRAARIGNATASPDAHIAVTIESASPADRMSLFGRACALSARELQLLGHVVRGADTRTIAQQMFLSENTVQDHLKSIFVKTSTRNRRTLLAHAVGT